MNIEELFDNEKWAGYGIVVTDDANQTFEYLTEVVEYVAGLEKRIAELEAQLKNAKEHASAAASWLQRGWISKAAEEIEKIGGDV